jgi:S1-C subfamily serine protease
LGFAIPINEARSIADQLIATGRVEHPYIGIRMQTLTPDLRDRINQDPRLNLRIRDNSGVVVLGIIEGSPAAQAGMRPGDVIRRMNNQTITSATDVQQVVRSTSIGRPIQLQLQRNGQSVAVTVRPAPLPEQALN